MESDEEVVEVGPYKLHQLEPKAREKAIDNVRSSEGYLCWDWYDSISEDFVRIGEILGFSIGTRYKAQEPAISFRLSYSQGDYACFDAEYRYSSQASSGIRQYCNDEELWRIADELTFMQVHQRLQGLEFFEVSVAGHEGRRAPRCDFRDWGIDEVGEPDEDRFHQIVRDLNDWIYNTLRSECDWLNEDEQVIAHIEANDYEFDEDGHTI